MRGADGDHLRHPEGDVDLDRRHAPARSSSAPCRWSTPLVVRHLEGELADADDEEAHGECVSGGHDCSTTPTPCDAWRCGPTPTPPTTPRAPGASAPSGIGLCRTEHMFLGERRELVENLILAEDDADRHRGARRAAAAAARRLLDILEAMDGLPVTIRLIDPPLHEFLPDLHRPGRRAWRVEDERGDARLAAPPAARRRAAAARAEPDARPARRPARHHDPGPGARCRRGRCSRPPPTGSTPGGDPRPELMVPLVAATASSRSCAG